MRNASVSMAINHNEKLWTEMIHFIGYAGNKDRAARMMKDWLDDRNIKQTPDGYAFTLKSIRYAMRGW